MKSFIFFFLIKSYLINKLERFTDWLTEWVRLRERERKNCPIRWLSWMINLNFLNGRIFNISPSYQKPNYRRKRSFSHDSKYTRTCTFEHTYSHQHIQTRRDWNVSHFKGKSSWHQNTATYQQHRNVNRFFSLLIFFLLLLLKLISRTVLERFVVRCVISGVQRNFEWRILIWKTGTSITSFFLHLPCCFRWYIFKKKKFN